MPLTKGQEGKTALKGTLKEQKTIFPPALKRIHLQGCHFGSLKGACLDSYPFCFKGFLSFFNVF